MTTRRRRREPRLDQSDNLLARARRRQRLDKCFTLNLAEIAQLFDKCLKIVSLHDILAGDKPPPTSHNIKAEQSHGGSTPEADSLAVLRATRSRPWLEARSRSWASLATV